VEEPEDTAASELFKIKEEKEAKVVEETDKSSDDQNSTTDSDLPSYSAPKKAKKQSSIRQYFKIENMSSGDEFKVSG